jgi:hypothetical protein
VQVSLSGSARKAIRQAGSTSRRSPRLQAV